MCVKFVLFLLENPWSRYSFLIKAVCLNVPINHLSLKLPHSLSWCDQNVLILSAATSTRVSMAHLIKLHFP